MRNDTSRLHSAVLCSLLTLSLGLVAGCTTFRTPYEGSAALIATATNLFPSASSVSSGTTVVLNATVTPAAADGTVTFYDGTLILGSNPLSSGTAAFSTASLAVGSHALTVAYSGSSTYAPSTSAPVTVVVSAANLPLVSITLTVSPTSDFVGGPPFVLTAVVTPSSATGTVSFYDGVAQPVTFPLYSGVTIDSTAIGIVGPYTHDLFAVYNGSATYAPSISNQIQFIASQPSVINPTMLLTVSPNPAVARTPVTITFTITPAAASGPYTLFDNGRIVTTGTVSSGTTTLTNTFAAGTHMLLVQFAGAGVYAPGYSNFVILTD